MLPVTGGPHGPRRTRVMGGARASQAAGVAMPVSKAPWVAGAMAALSAALMAAGLSVAFLDRHLVPASQTNWDSADVLSAVGGVAVAVTASVIAARRPANPIGWLGLTAGLALSVAAFATSYALRGGIAAPGSLPAWRAAAWLENWLWSVPTGAAAFVFLLFPTGMVRSRRWRPAAWFVAVVFCLLLVVSAVNATRDYGQPFTSFGAMQPAAVLGVELALVPVAMLVSVSALIVALRQGRGRGARPDEVARAGGRPGDRHVRA